MPSSKKLIASESSRKLHLRTKFLTQNQPNPRISTTYQYFLKNVDPLFGELISKLLLLQPTDVNKFLLTYFKSVKETHPFVWNEDLSHSKEKLRIDHKTYFTQHVSPIVTKLMKEVAIKKPSNISEFLYTECANNVKSNATPVAASSSGSVTKLTETTKTATRTDEVVKHVVPSVTNNNQSKSTEIKTLPQTHSNDHTLPNTKPSLSPKLGTANSFRSKLDDAKSLADSITVSNSARQSISRNKIENAINYEVTIQNNPEMTALRESTTELNKHQSKDTLVPSKSLDILSESVKKPSSEIPLPTTKPTITPTAAVTSTPTIVVTKPIENQIKSIQIALLGLGNSGKTTIINLMQGIVTKAKPTVGFRPVTLVFENDIKAQFYDLGGGEKIRGIWNQYYHDVHAIIYVIDVSSNDTEQNKAIETLLQVITHNNCKNKPLLIFLNKIDLVDNTTIDHFKKTIHDKLTTTSTITTKDMSIIKIIPCTALPNDDGKPVDSTIETHIESILNDVKHNYEKINDRVKADIQIKLKEDMLKRLEREKKVLKSKIALAYYDKIDLKILCELFQLINSENGTIDMGIFYGDKDIFDEKEGLEFLASEMTDENGPAVLPPLAEKVCSLVAYQRLALQIIGGFKAPTNKKRIPLTWEEIFDMVMEIRSELGIH